MEKLSKVWFGQFIKEIYEITLNIPERNFFDLKKDIQKLSILISRNLISSDKEYIKKVPIFIDQLIFFINIVYDFSYISKEQYVEIIKKLSTINLLSKNIMTEKNKPK